MKKILSILPLFVLIGCQLITEPDITDSEVFLLAPVDSFRTTAVTNTLWWDHVPDAESYNVLIVKPSWDAIEKLVVDTNVNSNKFLVSLPPGEYDWGVSAFNYSTGTAYYIRHITIDTSSSLNHQVVVLKTPEADNNLNKQKLVFEWYEIASADSYIFDIRKGSWQGESLIPQQITTYDTFSVALPEGIYTWGVKAFNDYSSTVFTTRNLTIDTTAPAAPIITYPDNYGDTVISSEAKLVWERPIASLSAITDSVTIAADSIFTTDIIYRVTGNTELSLKDYNSGIYYLKVRSFDAAGNIGEESDYMKLYIEDE